MLQKLITTLRNAKDIVVLLKAFMAGLEAFTNELEKGGKA